MKLNFQKTKRALSLSEKIHYYKIGLIFFSIPFIYLINEFINEKLNYQFETSHKISFVLIFIAIVIIWKKNNDLNLKSIVTRLNKNELNQEIQKLAKESNWNTISSSENQYEFKIKVSSFRSSNLFSFGHVSKRFIDAIIITHSGKFQLNLILDIENNEMIESFGEIKQWKKIIINRLK